MKVKVNPKGLLGAPVYTHLPYGVEMEYSNLLCNGNFPEYSEYLTPIIEWLQAEYGVGAFERWYDSNYAPGETFLIFSGGQSVVLY